VAPTILQLAETWRERAAQLRRYDAAGAAVALEEAADELEHAIHAAKDELLNLVQAEAESGYSADYLGRLIREGKIPNAGRPHAPKIRRGDLPKKATGRRRARAEPTDPAPTLPSLDAFRTRLIASRTRR